MKEASLRRNTEQNESLISISEEGQYNDFHTAQTTTDFEEGLTNLKPEVINVSEEQFDQFLKLVNQPAMPNPALEKLLNRKAPWE